LTPLNASARPVPTAHTRTAHRSEHPHAGRRRARHRARLLRAVGRLHHCLRSAL